MPAAIRNLVDANRALAISQEKSLMIRRWIILQFVECGHDVNRHLTGAYGTRIFSLLAPKVDEEFEELFTGADKDLKEPAIKCLINEAGSDHKYGENQRSVKPRPASSTAQDLARLPAFEPGLDITHDTSRRLVQLPSPDTLEDSSNAMSFKPNDIFLIATRIGTKERSEVALNQIRVDHSDATFEITDQQFEKWMMFLEEDIRLDLSREEILHVHHGTTAKIGRVRNLTALFGRLNGSVKEIHFTVAKVKDPAPTVVLLGPVPSNADPFATIPPPYDATSAIISTQNRTGGIKQEEVSPSGSTVVATEPQESARSRKPEKYAGVRKVRMNRGHKACPPPQLLWYAKENGRYREYWI